MKKKFKPLPLDKLSVIDLSNSKYSKELTEIVGLVSFESQGGRPASEDFHVHCFKFLAWRRVGHELVKRELVVLRPVPVDDDKYKEFPEGSVHKIGVLLSKDETRAVLFEVIENNAKDRELAEVAKQLAMPVAIDTDDFGMLTLDRRAEFFEGKASWNGKKVALRIEPNRNQDIASQLATARTLFADSQGWAKRITAFAVEEKLQLANDWREGKGKQITVKEFVQRMKLSSISIKRSGKFEFWYDDGGMFLGHAILISGSLKKGLLQSDIPG